MLNDYVTNKAYNGTTCHLENLIFENAFVKPFKIGQAILGGQKVIIIGCRDNFQFCLNVTSAIDGYIETLKDKWQVFSLTLRQARELYKEPKQNTVVRLDNIYIFKELYGFSTVSFTDQLIGAFLRVEDMAYFNPMNLRRVEDLYELPKIIIDKFHPVSQAKLVDKYGITYETLRNRCA